MNLVKNWRLALLGVIIILSLTLVMTKGLSYGIDFTGGTELKLEIEDGGPEVASAIVDILKERLNGLGLKSTQVLKEADEEHITIKVSSTDPEELGKVRGIIDQQAIFEQYVEGALCARGDEIQLNIQRQGGTFHQGTNWRVFVRTVGDAPQRCGEAMEGKAGHMTDIFLDRPQETFMLLPRDVCETLYGEPFSNNAGDSGYTMASFIEDRALIPIVCFESASANPSGQAPLNESSSILDELNISIVVENQTNATDATGDSTPEALDLSEAADRISELHLEGYDTAITIVPKDALPKQLADEIDSMDISVEHRPKGEDQPFHVNVGEGVREENAGSWIDNVTGLKSTLSIQSGLTYGKPIFESEFTGSSPTSAEAQETVQNYKIWLTSGNLPSKVDIILERPNLPELGSRFLYYGLIMALVALALVSVIISYRYREKKIFMAILLTSFSEILIIMGFASLMSWELDMAAIVGIIAVIGTGVDHQIVITDETLRGERRKKDAKIWDVKASVNRAFFIILASATTTICAMLPLMSIIDLRGFAFTSIVGILIGVLITRPAYGRIIELIT